MCPHPLHKKRGHRGEGGGGTVQKRLKRHTNCIFFLQRGLAQGARDCGWSGGGGGLFHPFHYRALTGVLHGTCSRASTLFATVVVVQSVADLGGGGGGVEGFERTPPKATNPLYFSNPLLNYPILIQVYTFIVASEFEPPPSHNSGSAPVSVKASDQCLKGRWFESTPRQPSLTVHMHPYI